MNAQQYILKEIHLQYSQLKEVAQCLMHNVTLDCTEFSFVRIDDAPTLKHVEDKSEELLSSIIKRKAKSAQMSISFFEKRQKTTFFSSNENVCWEQWIISFQLVPSMDTNVLLEQLTETHLKIISIVNQDRSYIPPISSTVNPFPYSISIAGGNDGTGGGGVGAGGGTGGGGVVDMHGELTTEFKNKYTKVVDNNNNDEEE
ncbi:DUF1649 family protein [Cavenderia fasciculata]|uniref:Autophagy-related protein 101 n=1 Tax=Cavenderia fasciculata TaxID=261658 RepID=F4QB24_CACFS|nr:DUF1649 family protein [Cavenderia fasciculata]EGG14796.1 DUF1649 family protein [Cavenderia fasciculata]|eukprot:XP_004351312.1 DUF1649 family protein [Cavenderia fasciculata]